MTAVIDARALARAEESFERAKASVEAMQAANSLKNVRLHWQDFVCHVGRFYTRMEKATKGSSAKGWFDGKKNERATDELLAYLTQARNAEEHGCNLITDDEPAGLTIKPTGVSHIQHIIATKQRLEVGFAGDMPSLTWGPERVVPAGVINRGVFYKPPTTHLGVALQNVTVISLADLLLRYLAAMLAEVRDSAAPPPRAKT